MVTTSLLMQTATIGGMNLSTINVAITLAVFAYLVYAVYYKRNAALKEKVSGLKGLIPAILLGVMALIPASSLALFGSGTGAELIMLILTVFTSGLMGYLFGYIALNIIDIFDPETIA